jgi:hypothetical protein
MCSLRSFVAKNLLELHNSSPLQDCLSNLIRLVRRSDLFGIFIAALFLRIAHFWQNFPNDVPQ